MELMFKESQKDMAQELEEQFNALPVGHTAIVLVIRASSYGPDVGMRRYRFVHKEKSGLLTSKFHWSFFSTAWDEKIQTSCFCSRPMSAQRLAKAMADYKLNWHSEVVHTFKGKVK